MAPKLPRAPFAVGLLAILVYANSFPGQFIWDDHTIVATNPLVETLDLRLTFTTDYWQDVRGSGLFRPLTILSLALNRVLLGSAPWGYHLVNVLLHALVSVMMGLVLTRWKASSAVAWLGAALFALHPIHGEVVNVVVGRSELLVALLLLLAFRSAMDFGWQASLVTGGWFLLALLSKENAIAFLGLLPLTDAFVTRSHLVWRERWRRYAGLALLAACWLAWREWMIPRIDDDGAGLHHVVYAPLAFLDEPTRVLTALKLQGLYLAKLLLPVSLQGTYSGPGFPTPVTPVSAAAVWTAGATALTLALTVLGWRRRAPLALFASLYFVSFLPTANILFPIGVSFAERLAYFPSVWFCAGVAMVIGGMGTTRLRRLAWWTGWGYALLLGGLCLVRNTAYQTEVKLWQTDVQRDPANVLAWMNLAEALANQGRNREAEEAFERMFAVMPEFSVGWRSYSTFLLATDRPREALAAATKALEEPNETDSKLNMARALLELKRYRESMEWLDQVTHLYGHSVQYWEIRGRSLRGLGRHAEAVEVLYGIDILPPGSTVPLELGLSLLELERPIEAADVLGFAIREMKMDSAPAWNALGVALAQLERWEEAADAFREAVERASENPYYRENLDRARRLLRSAPPVDIAP